MQDGKEGWAQAQQLQANLETPKISTSCFVKTATSSPHTISGAKICTGTWMSPSHVASQQAQAAYRACHHPKTCAREGSGQTAGEISSWKGWAGAAQGGHSVLWTGDKVGIWHSLDSKVWEVFPNLNASMSLVNSSKCYFFVSCFTGKKQD